MFKTLKVHFDGRVFVPLEAIDLPQGTELTLVATDEPDTFAPECMAEAQRLHERAKDPRTFTRGDLYRL